MNPDCQALYNGRFAHARLSNQNRVVLFPSAQNLRQPLGLLFASHNRVEAAFLGGLGHVDAKVVEHRRVRSRHSRRAFACAAMLFEPVVRRRERVVIFIVGIFRDGSGLLAALRHQFDN